MNNVRNIRFLVLDLDGVMTDSGIYIFADGTQARKFNAKDGEGLKRLARSGVELGIITGSKEETIVSKRAQMLLIKPEFVSIDTKDKLVVLENWRKKLNIDYSEIAYIGDDLPDIPILEKVGVGVCPSDAVEQVKVVSDIVLTKKGGDGCVREFVDMILFP